MAAKFSEPTPGLFQCWGHGGEEIPKDSENKARTIRFWSFSQPYMRAFHLNYIAFFLTFVSTFAPAVSPDIPLSTRQHGRTWMPSWIHVTSTASILYGVSKRQSCLYLSVVPYAPSLRCFSSRLVAAFTCTAPARLACRRFCQ